MDFNSNKPIFKQIADVCYARILSGEWLPGEKIPSVRELAVEFAVNTRTVLSAFELLEQEHVISSRRGLGFFLAPDAVSQVREARKHEFYSSTLSRLFADMAQLGISITDMVNEYEKFQNNKR